MDKTMKENNSNENIDYAKEITELLAKMSLREKLGQCILIEPCFTIAEFNEGENGEIYSGVLDPEFLEKLLIEYNIGSFLFGGVSRIGDGSPGAWADYILKVNEYVENNTRLKIPLLFGIDAVHGVNFVKGSTIYTHNLGVTATWNRELTRQYAALVGAELSAIGFNCNFAPTIDVARDPRWGRVYESLGEDPYLASVITTELIEGLQDSGNLAACAKHFIGYGQSCNGMDRTPADLSYRNIMEIHAPPFEAAIKSNVLTIMVSGASVNGMPMPASRKLLKDVLRDKFNFKGATMSDWEDVSRLSTRHKIAVDGKDAIAKAFNAGLDMNMAVTDLGVVDTMVELVEEGRISMERVDEAVRNVLYVKYSLGLFNQQPLDVEKAASRVGIQESKDVAKELALQSMTLLKNDNNLLPLSRDLKSILVTGISADSKRHLCGGWTLGWSGADEEDLNCKTVLGALQDIVSPDTQITYISDIPQLREFNASKNNYDVCICVISEEPHAEWFGDSMDMQLEEQESNTLMASFETGIPVVMVSLLGRPQNVSWAHDNIPSILWAYLPGTEGAEAIAEILFGAYNPSGRLPLSFPQDSSQIPVVYNARIYDSEEISTKYEPLYHFGFGLSYSQFEYSDLQVHKEIKTGQHLDVSIKVKNIGKVAGSEVVMLYLKDMYSSVTPPLKSLKSFARVSLEPGEEKTVFLKLGPAQLSLYDEDLNFIEEPREIEVQIGNQFEKFMILKQ